MVDRVKLAELEPPPVPCLQSLVEFGGLWEAALELEARTVVEVGSLFGGTLWFWLQLPGVERVVSVDLITDSEPVRDDVVEARALWFGWPGAEKLEIIEGDSHLPMTAELVGGPIDVLFLDGDHTFEGVSADWDLWRPLVRPGGIVGFHDTVQNGTRDEPGIRELVGRLKWELPSVEWFAPDGAGLTAFRV